jgi:hypothetical protein
VKKFAKLSRIYSGKGHGPHKKKEIDYLNTKCKCGHWGVLHHEGYGMCYFNCKDAEYKNRFVCDRRCNCDKFQAGKPKAYLER